MRPEPGGPLREAIEAARSLGLDTRDASAVEAEIRDRLGLAADAYVLALVGGTGVGKSSLLNALAGTIVSTASVRRPTTARPVAWVAASAADAARPLLDRLGVGAIRLHERSDLAGVVVLDLPDVDSLDEGHRAEVERLLPRVDAVAWVVDPEKYADAVVHDEFLVRWIPRLGRQLVVLNKSDRLVGADLDRVRRDVARLVAQIARAGAAESGPRWDPDRLAVAVTSATSSPPATGELLAWLREGSDAKAIVAARLAAAARAAVEGLAAEAGVVDERPRLPLLSDAERGRALRAATDDVLRVVDLRGAERQAVAATRAAARPRGAGPLGRITAFAYRASGRERRVADPSRYLRGWRGRGSLTRAATRVREAVSETVPTAPAALRPRYAAASEVRVVERTLGGAVEHALADGPPLDPPTSALWTLLGLLQTVATVGLVASAVWIVVWVVLRPPVDSVALPVLGRIPVPLALLGASLLGGYLVARLLALHAGWVGRRWARRIGSAIRDAVGAAIASEAFRSLDAIEEARLRLWTALRELDRPGA